MDVHKKGGSPLRCLIPWPWGKCPLPAVPFGTSVFRFEFHKNFSDGTVYKCYNAFVDDFVFFISGLRSALCHGVVGCRSPSCGHCVGLCGRKTGCQIKPAFHFGLADYRHGFGAACVEPVKRFRFGLCLVRCDRKPAGMHGGPDDWHRAFVAPNEKGGCADCCNHYHGISGNFSCGKPGVQRHILGHRHPHLSGLYFRRHCAGHRARAIAVYCKPDANLRPGYPHADSHGSAG